MTAHEAHQTMSRRSPEGFNFRMFDFVSEVMAGSIRCVIALSAFDHFLLSSFDIDVADQFLINIIPAIDLKS